MSKLTLPAWDDLQAKVLANPNGIDALTAIEQFIHNNEPCGGEDEFRMELAAALQEVAETPLAELFPRDGYQHLTLAEEWDQYTRLKQVTSEWIDITERMPPPHQHIWCLNRDGRQFEGCPCYGMHSPFFTIPHGDGSASNTAPSWIDVTHWRALPALPTAVTDNLRKIDFYSGALHALVLIMSAQVPAPEFNDWVRTLFIEVKPYADHMKGVIAGLTHRPVKP